MKDAFGGILNIFIIVVVLLLIMGVLGLTVNYTKAFRMKNYVITAFENFEAAKCWDVNSACYNSIVEKAKSIGYSPRGDLSCPQEYERVGSLFCYREINKSKGKYIYSIQTQVDINIPIINKIMGLNIFKIHGDTRIITKKN